MSGERFLRTASCSLRLGPEKWIKGDRIVPIFGSWRVGMNPTPTDEVPSTMQGRGLSTPAHFL